MFKCNYCGRVLKQEYNSCPGCGASSFKKIANANKIVIKTPPKDGYKINITNHNKEKTGPKIFFWVGIIILIVSVVPILPMIFIFLAFNPFSVAMFIPFIIFPLIVGIPFIIIGKTGINKINEKIEKIKTLKTTGILIKNLEYKLKPTGTVIMGQKIYAIQVIYENEAGIEIPLTSEGKYDGRLSRADGTVDLLIDPNDSSNYYIDFEIY